MNRRHRLLLLASLLVILVLAPLASGFPDGLERVAEDLGFAEAALANPLPAPLPDYSVPGIESGLAGTIIAGIVGGLLVYAALILVTRLLCCVEKNKPPGGDSRYGLGPRLGS